MTDPGHLAEPAGLLRLADGLSLLGEYQGSGFTEPRFLVRRGDGQVIQLSRLLYLVTQAIAEDGGGRGGWDAGQVAARAGASFGREITADNVRYLVTGKLAPLGVVVTDQPRDQPHHQHDHPGHAGHASHATGPPGPAAPPRASLLLGLRLRGVLLPPRAASAIGQALAWLHYPALAVLVLGGFAAFEVWLFVVHGAIGPVLGVLSDPVLLLAVAGLTLVSLLFHEFGHASACRYGGARPGAIGFGLYLVWPSLYTDVTDVYRLGRAGRLRTDLGGVYFNAIFILILGACYAATGQPVFLAAAFADNFQILQQVAPLVRMDGYFILADLAGVPDLLGLLGPIMASLLPARLIPRAWAGARSRAHGLRRRPRILVTAWVLVAVPLLITVGGYTAWHLPSIVATAARSFTSGLATTRTAFAAGHAAAGLVSGLNLILLVIPLAGLAYLAGRISIRGARALRRLTARPRAARPPGVRRRPRLTVVLAALCAMAAGAGVTVAVTGTVGPRSSPGTSAAGVAAANRVQAAAWVAGQADAGTTVSCDPAMCGQLRGHGVPAAQLKTLGDTAGGPLGTAVVMATPALRQELGTSLATAYAPLVLASFGSGPARVEVRAVAPDGAAAFRSQMSAGQTARADAGRQLLGNPDLHVSPAVRTALLAGQADSRLLTTLSALAAQMPVQLVALDGRAPGASAVVPLPGAEIAAASAAARSAVLAFLRAQQAPYRPVAAALGHGPGGQPVITVRFGIPAQPGAG
jgi:putative peptide zinc metalloprotease protein